MFGRRRMLLVGVAGFVVASLVCALAGSPEMLVAARVLQGLFGAVMIPQCFGLIRDLFPPDQIGKAFAAVRPGHRALHDPRPGRRRRSHRRRHRRHRLADDLPDQPAARCVRADRRRARRCRPRPAPGERRLDVPARCSARPAWRWWSSRWCRAASWAGRCGRSRCWAASPVFAAVRAPAAAAGRGQRGSPAGASSACSRKRSYTSGVVFVIVFFGAHRRLLAGGRAVPAARPRASPRSGPA